MPDSDMLSVRGIGVAVSVSTSTLAAQRLDALLVLHAEAVLLVDHEKAELAECDVLLQQPVRADHDVDACRSRAARRSSRFSAAVRKRDSISTLTG